MSGLFLACVSEASWFGPRTAYRRSVVKVYVTALQADYKLPWQGGSTVHGSGSGFIVTGRRILTNAHVVSDARFIEVEKDGDPRRYVARVAFIGHDCDLALLAVDEPAFFEGTLPMALGSRLPRLDETVTVLGYPVGGNRMSVTRGVVSRIDYSGYSHSAVDAHLVVQVDAAINPGNSGGPVMYRGKAIGVAFQGLRSAENIGYAIPIPVMDHFLGDVADGRYDGYPELGVSHWDLRNEALRRDLRLPPSESGVVVYFVDPFASAAPHIRAGDVLLAIDGHDIANDGTIVLAGENVDYTELMERKQCGETIHVDIWRDGGKEAVDLRLGRFPESFVFRQRYDELPEFVVLGGLVFAPLTRNYVQSVGRGLGTGNSTALIYYMEYAKTDGLYEGRSEFVVLIGRLPHPVNTYAGGFTDRIVTEVNGRPIRCLADLRGAIASPQGGFHVVRFEGEDDFVVLDAERAARAMPEISERYGVSATERVASEDE